MSSATAPSHLRSFIERLERLEEDKAAILGDIKEVCAEAKGQGFDAAILKKIVRLRKDPKKTAETQATLDLYLSALGGL